MAESHGAMSHTITIGMHTGRRPENVRRHGYRRSAGHTRRSANRPGATRRLAAQAVYEAVRDLEGERYDAGDDTECPFADLSQGIWLALGWSARWWYTGNGWSAGWRCAYWRRADHDRRRAHLRHTVVRSAHRGRTRPSRVYVARCRSDDKNGNRQRTCEKLLTHSTLLYTKTPGTHCAVKPSPLRKNNPHNCAQDSARNVSEVFLEPPRQSRSLTTSVDGRYVSKSVVRMSIRKDHFGIPIAASRLETGIPHAPVSKFDTHSASSGCSSRLFSSCISRSVFLGNPTRPQPKSSEVAAPRSCTIC